MLIHVGAPFLLIENISKLVDDDHIHHLLSSGEHKLKSSSFSRVHLWRLTHSLHGGATQRVRVFLLYVQDAVGLKLSPPQLDYHMAHPSPIRQHLRAVEHVPAHEWLDGELEMVQTDRPQQHESHLVAKLWYGGHWPIRGGSLVTVTGRSEKWRVMVRHGEALQLMNSDREHPTFRCATIDEVLDHLWDSHLVFSIDSPGITWRAFGEPMSGDSMLILDTRKAPNAVRRVLGDEKWSSHGLTSDAADVLQNTGCSIQLLGKAAQPPRCSRKVHPIYTGCCTPTPSRTSSHGMTVPQHVLWQGWQTQHSLAHSTRYWL